MFNLDKHLLKICLSLILLLLSTSKINAGVLTGCFGSTEYQPVSAKKLKVIADGRTSEMGICYEAAICLARSEKSINKKQASYLLDAIKSEPGTSYTTRYKQILGLNDESKVRSALNIDEVTESGFVNFQETVEDNNFVHTAYIQVTRDGEKFFYNANNLEADLYLSKAELNLPIRAGRSSRYLLSENKITQFNLWLRKTNLRFYYTPVTELSENISSLMTISGR